MPTSRIKAGLKIPRRAVSSRGEVIFCNYLRGEEEYLSPESWEFETWDL